MISRTASLLVLAFIQTLADSRTSELGPARELFLSSSHSSPAGASPVHRQWIPTEFEVNFAERCVLGVSHLEHGDSVSHNDVYQAVMHVFQAGLPLIERVLLTPLTHIDDASPPVARWLPDRTRNVKLQVVVKAREFAIAVRVCSFLTGASRCSTPRTCSRFL